MSELMSRPLGTQTITVLVPTGALGAGVDAADVARGIALGIDAIACDAGSTDSGPSYLARAVSKVSRESIKSDLSILIPAAFKAGVPLIVGSCGTSGADAGVDWTRDIALEVAQANGIAPKIALLYSEQSHATIEQKLAADKISSLSPATDISGGIIAECNHIVALMGVEPYIEALKQGADIVLGGRTTDTAVLGCVPIMKGAAPGLVWHAAKITECGGLCSVNPREGGVLFRIGDDSFEVEPLRLSNSCTPYTVSSHMLYENSDPFLLTEPGGILDVTCATYEAVDDRITKVTGSRWTPQPYTMKLEGAGGGPFQTIMLIGIGDPKVLSSLEVFQERMLRQLNRRVETAIGEAAGDHDISLRVYGWSGISGQAPAPGTPIPSEVGVMFVATASSQEMATRIAKTCNPIFFHFPLDAGMELPSYAFPFSPAEIERGQVYAFKLNHVVAVENGLELVRIGWADYPGAAKKEGEHA